MTKKQSFIMAIALMVTLILILMSCLGCVHTKFEKTETGFKGNRWAFLYPFESGASVDPATGIITFNYSTDGGASTIEQAVKAGFEAGKKAAKSSAAGAVIP